MTKGEGAPAPARQVRPFGESAFVVGPLAQEDPDEMVANLRELRDVEEVVPGPQILVRTSSRDARPLMAEVDSLIPYIDRKQGRTHGGRLLEIPVRFDSSQGPDLEAVARSVGMEVTQLIANLAETELRVEYLGFSPGFAYMTGLPEPLARIGRRTRPRTSIPAGSVGIAGGYVGIYPQASPGGWNLVGRAHTVMFDPFVPPYATLRPADRVRLLPTDQRGTPPPMRNISLRPRCASARRIVVEQPGTLTTLQDSGRRGVAHLGVPRAGPADPHSMSLANLIVGNDTASGVLEATVRGPLLRFDATSHAAVVGAGVELDGRRMEPGAVIEVPAGARLRITACDGLRAYMAVSGGIRGPELFGSCSSDMLSGLGLGALSPGDELELGNPGNPRGYAASPFAQQRPVVRVLPGPDLNRQGSPGSHGSRGVDRLREWAAGPFVVSTDSNRVGVRLAAKTPQGAPPTRHEHRSYGMIEGAVQLLPSGEAIALLCDHATMGGYPVVATVVSADIGALAQKRPGDVVQFDVVALDEALEARSAVDRWLARAPTGRYPAGPASLA